jgi:hypothetical protein
MLIKSQLQMIDQTRAWTQYAKEYFGNRQVTIAEIGTERGCNAVNMLNTLNIDKLRLVDPYSINYLPQGSSQIEVDGLLAESNKNLARYEDKLIRHRLPSLEAVKHFPQRIDGVYLDGNHGYPNYTYVITEIMTWWHVVKNGGIIGGHDFVRAGSYEFMGVFAAICELVAKNNIDVFISNDSYADWWMIKDVKQPLTMWV